MPDLSIAQETEEYLKMRSSGAKSLEHLRDDPSGFMLMDASVGMVNVDSFQAREYVTAGAELARDLYKILYEIAAPLYPEKPSK